MLTKKCGRCKIIKSIDEFNSGTNKFGKEYRCRPCQQEYDNEDYRKRHKKQPVIDLEYEFWLPIKGYEGIYLISNQKRIKSLSRIGCANDRILKLTISTIGYYTAGLVKNKKKITKFFHVLYATAFLPNPNNLPQINHLDGDKLNNELWNYEWCTAKRNIQHARDIGLNKTKIGIKGNRSLFTKLSESQAKEIIASNLKCKELSKKYGVSICTISLIRNRKRWTHL